MIAATWPDWFWTNFPGGKFPDTVLCFDLETSGYSLELDVITQFGHVMVENGKVVDRLQIIVDWTGRDVPPDSWLRDRLASLQRHLREKGSACGITYQRMQQEGVKPEKALRFYYDLFMAIKAKGVPCAAHNGYGFDEQVLESNFAGFGVANGFDFGENGLIDTDLLERANQVPEHPRVKPWRGDTLRSYFGRLRGLRLKGIKSNLDTHCFGRYSFAERGVRREDMHTADVDAFCVHLLLESFRAALARNPRQVIAPGLAMSSARPAQPAPVATIVSRRRRGQRSN